MRSPWSEAYEDVTPPPTDEERESDRAMAMAAVALSKGHDISRDTTGTRCSTCKVKRTADGRCLCGGSKGHG